MSEPVQVVASPEGGADLIVQEVQVIQPDLFPRGASSSCFSSRGTGRRMCIEKFDLVWTTWIIWTDRFLRGCCPERRGPCLDRLNTE